MVQAVGPVILDIAGTEIDQEDKALLGHPSVGGVILFARNFENPSQLRALCDSIRQARPEPLLIFVDQEGGRVQRFREGFVTLPPMQTYGKCFDLDPELGCHFAELGGWIMASEVLAAGIDLSLAPVLDLNKSMHSVVGDRSFHRDPFKVISLARAFIKGMRNAGMATTGKHFPGHGSVAADSHVTLPIDERSINEITNDDIVPFVELMKSELDVVMPAHIIFSSVDDKPVGFSSYWLKKILRERYQFKGVVISDDLNMAGAAFVGDYPSRAMAALDAGCDMLLICNNRQAAIQMIDGLPRDCVLPAEHFTRLRTKSTLSFDRLRQSNIWREKTDAFEKICERNELIC